MSPTVFTAWIRAVSATAAVAAALSALDLTAAPSAAEDPPVPSDEEGPGAVLLDGTRVPGELRALTAEGFLVGDREAPLAPYEVQEVRLAKAGADAGEAADFLRHPLVRFQGGEQVAARVVEVTRDEGGRQVARLKLVAASAEIPELRVPLESISAFRLREVHPSDDLFEKALEAAAPERDTLFVRRTGLLSLTGTFRGLSQEHVFIERGDALHRVQRQLVQGVVFAPVASARPETDPPAVLDLPGAGRVPAYLTGVEGEGGERVLVVRMPGAPQDALTSLPFSAVSRVHLASDRVLFLSAVDPVVTDERPVLGEALRFRKDQSVSGAPLSLGGRKYRRGLGVHSYSALDFALDGKYRAFAAVIGLDDSAQGKGSVTFRVLADGKEVFAKEMSGAARPEPVSLPMENVKVLRLVVDYGADQLDFSDHADWADARVTR